MRTQRIPVPLTDQTRKRIEAYAAKHGASMAGAILALAVRQLELEEATEAAGFAPNQRDRRYGK